MAILDLDSVGDFIGDFVELKFKYLGMKLRSKPLVGIASASDELFSIVKRLHPSILLPREILNSARSVIVIAVPMTEEAVASNVGSLKPSVFWARDYVVINKVLSELSTALCEYLESLGHQCIPIRPTHEFDEKTLTSRWSHRHAAYIAGLGTFGVNRMIITKYGSAIRLSTVITSAHIDPTPRPDYEFCLAKRGSECLKCITRCPVNALKNWEEGGKYRCWSILRKNALLFLTTIGMYADVCGKCVCGTPCSTEIPS